MRRIVAMALLMSATVLAAQDQAKQCRANLKQWASMFKAAYDDPACKGDGSPSCPFAPAIRSLNVTELIQMPFEAEACIKTDRRHRYDYERVAARAENILVMRTAYFLKTSNQMEDYVEWESRQRVGPTAPAAKDDESTVASN
jgi:hypothetical protein